MHSRQVISAFVLLGAAGLAAGAAFAMEAVTESNERASTGALFRQFAAERADQLSDLTVLQAQVDRIISCTAKGRFYTPSKSGADADGCTDIEVTVN